MTQEAKVLIGIGVASLILIVGAVFFLGQSSGKSTPVIAESGVLIKEDSQKIATDSAKVNIVEFSDYECPACAAANPIIKQVVNDYQGKVNFYYRHFPLPQHKNAQKAAALAEAAGEQGKFWQMHDLLFGKQDEWIKPSDTMALFLNYAQQLDLEQEKLKKDMESEKLTNRIKRDLNDATSLSLNATPTFFVNGEKMESFAYETFKNKIDSELSR